MPETPRGEIGLWTAVALVMGNMIGSGVFLLPASLAAYGGLSLIGWIISAGGSVCLALVFARLARLSPDAGGPYAYTRRAFGDLAGFLVAWGYWISVWSANAALAVAFVGYLDPFVPGLVRTPVTAALLAVGMIWLLTAVNILGVRAAGRVQVVTTVVKILPLALIGVAGLMAIHPEHFAIAPTAAGGMPVGQRLLATVTLTLFAFLGLECATIPAASVRDPRRTIPRATMIGTLLAAAIYIISTAGVMGVVPPDALAKSTAPFADAATLFFGGTAGAIVAIGGAISCFGALNGWILVVGQLPLAVARDGLFPAIFGRVSANGTPTAGMVVSGALASVLVAMNFSRGLVALFTFIILLATLSTLVPYVFCALAVFLDGESPRIANERLSAGMVVVAALAFAVLALRDRRRRHGGRLLGVPVVDVGAARLRLGRAAAAWGRQTMSDVGMARLSEAGLLTRLVVKHARDAFSSREAIAREWRDLNFTSPPDFARAVAEYDRFLEVLSQSGAEIQTLPPSSGVGLDSIYVRDASVVCGRGVILCRMGKAGRAGEPAAQQAAFAAFGIPVIGAIQEPGKLEGGDVVWLDDRTIAVGRGYRTNDAGIAQLREILGDSIDELIVVPLVHWRGAADVFHLMSIISPVDRDLAVVYSPLMPVAFRERLLDTGYALVDVPEDEFDSMGANVLAIGPRRCVMLSENPRTRSRLEAAGAEVFEYEGREISLKGGGGPTCLTRPIERA